MYQLEPIGHVATPFKDKFGIPRQASLLSRFTAQISLRPPYDTPDAVRGLEAFSHLWINFLFHENDSKWRPLVRPPRLGGNDKVGVFASRSSFRPNGLGLSLVELRDVQIKNNSASLIISCPDLLDHTPVIDIKPYISYADTPETSRCAYAEDQPEPKLRVDYAVGLEEKISVMEHRYGNQLRRLVDTIVIQDPRPAYKRKKEDAKQYYLRLYDLEIAFEVVEETALIQNLSHCD